MPWPELDLCGIDSDIRAITHTDRKIAAFAKAQHRTVARRQLLRVGIESDAIQRRVQSGRLFPKYRGVYAVGSPDLTQHGEWSAAVLSCGNPALLSHRSGAGLVGFLKDRWPIQVTVPDARVGKRGVRLYRAPTLSTSDITLRAGIPTTSIARLFVDLAATEDDGTVRRAFREADRQKRLVYADLRAALGSCHGRKGVGVLRALIDEATEPEPTKSAFEEMWVDFCVGLGIPAPLINANVGGFEVDAHWPGTRVIVELDSWTWHSDRRAFESDRAKWERLQVAGYKVLPITYRRMTGDPTGVAASVLALLRDRRLDAGRDPQRGG